MRKYLFLILIILFVVYFYETTYTIVIDKGNMTLTLFNVRGKEIFSCPVTTGINPGQKHIDGDCKTPEGKFKISEVQDASKWMFDYNDGNGPVAAYGPYFLRLETPGHSGIGIHGTSRPEKLGQRDSHGCIRILNKNIRYLKQKCRIGTSVIILPGFEDLLVNNKENNLRKKMDFMMPEPLHYYQPYLIDKFF